MVRAKEIIEITMEVDSIVAKVATKNTQVATKIV
jgi:hypothetical protein